MLLKYFYDERLAQASYVVGCVKTGEALVVDPARHIAPYLDAARKHGLRITHVTETHIHADYLSGTRELAAATGATMYLSDEGDANWKYAFADAPNARLVRDGDAWMVGNVRVEVMATPGHTPEHIAFVITDTAGADKPMGIFTGDALFVGDIGRPDLLEEAAGMIGTKEVGARGQFRTVNRFKAMPDYLQVWPAHGAGSACGKALGAIPSTTIGYEKLFNPAFQFDDEAAFVRWLLDGQPEAPRYFAQMKKLNKLGPPLLRDVHEPARMDAAALRDAVARGELVLDLRPREAFARGHVAGTVSLPTTDTGYVTYLGWFADYGRPLYVIAPSEHALPDVLRTFRSIGLDGVAGCALPEAVHADEPMPSISARVLAERIARNGITVIDVRNQSEWRESHLRGAVHIPLGFLPRNLDSVPREQPVMVHCASGYRSTIGASYLRAHGFANVVNVASSYDQLAALLPTERG